MDKVAYLALTYSDFAKPSLMRRFFNEQNKDCYNLYIHNKNDLNDIYFRKFIIKASLKIETQWGQYSLTQATCILLKEALKDPNNKKFVIISDSHIPLYGIKTVSDRILSLKTPMFGLMGASLFRGLWLANPPPEFKEENTKNVSQWFVCGREDAKLFVEKEKLYRDYFIKDKHNFVEEIWFDMVATTFGHTCTYKDNCYVSWSQTPPIMGRYGAKLSSPQTFRYISNKFIDRLRSRGFLFVRKINPFTEIEDEDYLLEK